jgi:hypothetical protein
MKNPIEKFPIRTQWAESQRDWSVKQISPNLLGYPCVYLKPLARGGHAQLFLSSQSQFRNRKFFKSPQFQVRNLRTSLPQFSPYFWPWISLKLHIFYRQVFFAIQQILKGQ